MSFERLALTERLPLGSDEDGPQVPAAPETSLQLKLHELRPILDIPSLSELCINRPKEAFIQTHEGWHCRALPFADFNWCRDLAKLVAGATKQRVDQVNPLLSGNLPSGERVQCVLPPAAPQGQISITIRRPSQKVRGLDELYKAGLFDRCTSCCDAVNGDDLALGELLREGRFDEFLRACVKQRKNIIVSGSTGTGKTTTTNCLLLEIPAEERLITIEDADELVLSQHPNHVRLFYSKGGQGLAQVTPRMLLEACLRMRPDRVFLSELRSDEAFDYLRVIAAHPGSITSVHGATARLALVQLMLLVKQSPAGQSLSTEDVWMLLHSLIDVVVQLRFEGNKRMVKEIWYDPQAKFRAAA